jgi:2-oxoisovalerate dehydrogenase E2 component (dihydrolipoyl transacylase)
MTTDITMPQLGESVTEGTIGRWLKQPGDAVAKYEALLEVVTDKVDTEVPAPVAGTLLEILVPEGETVRVGTVIARVGVLDREGGESSVREEREGEGLDREGGESSVHEEREGEAAKPRSQERETLVSEAGAQRLSSAREEREGAADRRSYMSPVVARLVAEHGLDIGQIPGSGMGGRVTKQDVLRFIEDGRVAAAAPDVPATGSPLPPPASTPAAAPSPSPRPPFPDPQSPHPRPPTPTDLPEDAELLPLTPMRRAIAEHMAHSVRVSPHVTTVMEVDLSAVLAHREASRAAFERQGVRLTLTPYFLQAAAAALQRFPVMNGSFTEQGIVLNRRVHLGMAVALDEGLIVPVVRDADEKNLLGLARAVNDLSERARGRRLKPDETQGGTFTLTNHGTSGSLFATPIINQPQAAILGVGAIVKRPVVVSQGGVDAIAIKPMCYLSLTFDHRIADGAVADGFLAAVRSALEAVAPQA